MRQRIRKTEKNMYLVRELTMTSILLRVVLACGIGMIIGAERLKKNHTAGTRTYMLVCLGACLVMMTNQYITMAYQTGDPSRLGAQVISGIGFLGAGTIMVTKNNQIHGLTSAAGLWTSGCVGLALGIGFYEGAIAAAVAVLLIMGVFKRFDAVLQARSPYLTLHIDLENAAALTSFLDAVKEKEIRVEDLQIIKNSQLMPGSLTVLLRIQTPAGTRHEALLDDLRFREGVLFIQELTD